MRSFEDVKERVFAACGALAGETPPAAAEPMAEPASSSPSLLLAGAAAGTKLELVSAMRQLNAEWRSHRCAATGAAGQSTECANLRAAMVRPADIAKCQGPTV